MTACSPWTVACVAFCLATCGCGPSNVPQPRPMPVARNTLAEVRNALSGYAAGQAVGSERELFDGWVEEIRATAPETADLLGPGLREIVGSPGKAATVAARLLAKLPKEPESGTAPPETSP